MYKIIFIDIDGTLRNDKKEITDRTKRAIDAVVKKGIYVVICSGRPGKYVESVSKEALASNYIIACNGGEIYDYNKNREIYINVVDSENVLLLWHMAEKYNVQAIIISKGNRYTRQQINDKSDILLNQAIEDFVKNNEVTQLILSSLELEKIQDIKTNIEKIKKTKNIEIVNLSKHLMNNKFPQSKPLFLDITCKETSKGNAIKKICDYLKIDLKDTVAIGDSYNDLTMFEVVGHSVAMGNSPEEIKSLVDEVIDSNNEDGVAKFLELVT